MYSRTSRRYDVVVVGARCAGAATAMLLSRAGLRVLLVDRLEPGTDTLSTHALMRAGVLQLSKWGLLDGVIAAGTPPITRTTFDYGTHMVDVDIKPGAGVSALYAPRRTLLDRLLVDAAAAAGATTEFGVTVTGVHRDQTGRVWGITGRDRQRRVFNAYTPLVVGADGVRSTIAEAVRAPVIRQGRGVGAVWYTYVSGLPNLGYRWYYRPGATAGIIPTNDGLTCVFAGMHARAFRAAAGDGSTQGRWGALLDALIAAGPNAVGELRRAMPAERVRGWPGMASYVRAAHGLGWALVGDAGYFKDPMGAHGITQALRDAQLLAEAILAAHGGEEPIARSLARYQHVRDELSADLFAVVDEIAAYTWDSRRADKLLRGLSAAMEPEIGHLAPTPVRPCVHGARAGG